MGFTDRPEEKDMVGAHACACWFCKCCYSAHVFVLILILWMKTCNARTRLIGNFLILNGVFSFGCAARPESSRRRIFGNDPLCNHWLRRGVRPWRQRRRNTSCRCFCFWSVCFCATPNPENCRYTITHKATKRNAKRPYLHAYTRCIKTM